MMKTTVAIDGMMCAMCESHINEAIRKAMKVKKVSASRKNKEAVILSEEAPDPVLLTETIRQTGILRRKRVSATAETLFMRKMGLFPEAQ